MNDTLEHEHSPNFIRDLGDAVRKNPLSAALIGMGAVWLFTNRSGPISDMARDAWQGTANAWRSSGQTSQEGAQTTTNSVRDRGSNAVDRLSDAGNALASSARDYVDAAPNLAGSLFSDVRENLGELFRAQPLALGAVGLAIGAAVATSLPSSGVESTYLGESSDYVKHKVGEIAGQQTQRAVEIGKKVVDAAADEARQQGLTAEALTATARDFSGKVSRVADAATKTNT
jgi:hypothetical protein